MKKIERLIGILTIVCRALVCRALVCRALVCLALVCLAGCAGYQSSPDLHYFQPPEENTQKVDEGNEPLAQRMRALTKQQLNPEETKKVLGTAAENFAYGPGLGETALDITGIVLFPPYALVLAGQAALALSGHEPVRLANVLPKEGKESYQSVMDTVYSGPGRVVSLASGESYRNRADIKEEWKAVLGEIEISRENRRVKKSSGEKTGEEFIVKASFFPETVFQNRKVPSPQFFAP